MEYLPGLSLEELVRRHGPLPLARAIHLLRQVCAALQEAHTIGLIHRDIKPANIVACSLGGIPDVAKLLDFGLVRETGIDLREEKLTQDGALARTPAYMSPEQAGGRQPLDARSDIYSLGAVAYFLLTGREPFEREGVLRVMMAHVSEAVRPLRELQSDVPADVEVVVLRCLAKEPAQRYANAPSLERALASCRCAGEWNESEAAAWWRSVGDGKATLPATSPSSIPAAAE